MRPFQPPPTSGASSSASPSPFSSRSRFRSIGASDLTLGVPQRDHSLAVPLPLPPGAPPAASASTSNKIHPLINFSELEKLNRIGSGNGGTVYKVRHRPSNSFYALKVIYGNHEAAVRNQICREIEILRGADNPHVVKCYGMFDYHGDLQVLLEHMDRGSLEGIRVGNERALSDISRQILHGLAYLHSRKVVHRDIKPSNLLMNSGNEVKIADFGVSRILAQTMDNCNSSVGTIAYMSPERINTDLNHGKYDGYAGDIWSFGVSILELYLGRYPFSVGRQGEWASLMVAICMSQPPEAPPTASIEFRDFVARCLQIDPTRRSTSARLLHHPFILQNGAPASAPGGIRSNNSNNKAVLLPPPRSSPSSSFPSCPAHPSSC